MPFPGESLRLKFALKFQWFFPLLVVAWPHHFIRISNHHAVSTSLSALSYSGLSTALLEVPSRQKSWRPPGGLPLYADHKGEPVEWKKIEHLLRLGRNLWCGNAGTNSSVFQAHNALTDETAKDNYEKWACGMWWQRCFDSLLYLFNICSYSYYCFGNI